jgi:NAD(P)-dependent dehydrogenase (short-subunit alcohol dehydrogenase family)
LATVQQPTHAENDTVAEVTERAGRLRDQVAWVTGAGKGIGAAIATRFAAEGAHVAVLARTRQDVDEVAKNCRAHGTRALALPGDAGELETLKRAHERIERELGPVDILVNNVAVALESPLLDATEEFWDRVLAVNFRSVVRCSKYVIPSMRERGGGSIINVSSLHAVFGDPGWSAYASAKGALNSFSRQQAVEQAPYGIRVNILTPGPTRTPLTNERLARAEDPVELEQTWTQIVPLRRLGTSEEVAAVAAFLASDEAAFVTGAEYCVDGGQAVQV